MSSSQNELDGGVSADADSSPATPPPQLEIAPSADTASSQAEIVRDIWRYYRQHHKRARLGDKERRLIKARLADGYSPDDLKKAIDGYHRSPFHCGENDRGKKYQSAELIFRTSSHVQQGIEMATGPPKPALSERTKRSLRAGEAWLAKMEAQDASR